MKTHSGPNVSINPLTKDIEASLTHPIAKMVEPEQLTSKSLAIKERTKLLCQLLMNRIPQDVVVQMVRNSYQKTPTSTTLTTKPKTRILLCPRIETVKLLGSQSNCLMTN